MKLFGGARYAGVAAFVGMPGSGKTYALVRAGVRAMAEGRPVYVNNGFNLAGARTYRSFEEMLLIPNGSLVLLDEAPAYFNARRWQEFPDGLLYRLTQVRKDGLQFMYSAIHEEMVDVTLRRLTFYFTHCRAITRRLLLWRTFPPELFRKADARPLARRLVYVRTKIASQYDTHAKVDIKVEVLRRIVEMGEELFVPWNDGETLEDVLVRARAMGVLPPAGAAPGQGRGAEGRPGRRGAAGEGTRSRRNGRDPRAGAGGTRSVAGGEQALAAPGPGEATTPRAERAE